MKKRQKESHKRTDTQEITIRGKIQYEAHNPKQTHGRNAYLYVKRYLDLKLTMNKKKARFMKNLEISKNIKHHKTSENPLRRAIVLHGSSCW